jgi:hypothetical protein
MVSFMPGHVTPRERAAGAHWIDAGWAPDPRRGDEEKNSQPLPGIEFLNLARPARSISAISTELSRLLLELLHSE